MRLTISHALLPVIYLVALPLNAADSIPESFQPKKESTVPTDLKTNSSYQDSWDYTQEKWGQKYPNLQIKDNKYLADRDIVLLNPAFSKQVVTLINHSYSVGNTLNSVQLNIGDGINEANGSEALNTLVKGEYVNSRGNIETGVLSVNSNGKAFNTVVDAYGSLSVSGDGEVYNSLIKTGGLQVLGTRAYAQANIIDGGVQQLSITGNAVAEDNIVKNGGQQIIYAGTAKNSHIGDGSYQLASGLAQDTVLYSGAFQKVYSGKGDTYVADSHTQVLAGAFQQITSGISENAQVYGTQTVSGVDVTWKDGSWTSDEGSKIRINGQTAKNSTIYAGGKQRIQSGTADGTQVYGVQTISGQKGGWVDGKWVDADGYTGGIRANATNTTVYAGGLQHIAWYGEADQNIIDGGTQRVDELGHISNTTIQNDGASTIAYGAYSSGDLIVKDGSLSMQAGSDHAWTGNLGKGAYAANVDLQSDNAYLYIQHNDATPESVVTIKQLTNNGVVNFGAQNSSDNGRFSRLDLNTLSGSGTFIMNTNLAGEEGDFLNISDSVSGNFHVLVRDSGYELTGSGANPYHLIFANGSSADTFAMTNGSVDLGAYKYYLVHGDASDKDNWYLSPTAVKPNPEPDPDPTPDPDPKPDPKPDPDPTPDPGTDPGPDPQPEPEPTPEPTPNPEPGTKPELSESAKSVLAMANVTPTIWDAELSTLRSRLGEVRNNQQNDTGVWGKYISSRYRISTSNVGYNQELNGVMFGGDRTIALDNAQMIVGGMASYTHSELEASKSNGKVDSYSVGAYITWLHDSGYYLDGVVKANRFRTENNPYFNGGRAHAHDNSFGAGFSLEAGRHISFDDYFVEPYLQAAFFRGERSEYKLDSGMKVKADAAKSVKGELGTTLGKNFPLANGATIQPYARLAVRHEFMKDNAVVINNTEHFNNDMSGTSGKYGLGVTTRMNDRWAAYGEINYEMGHHIETPYSGQIGVRYSF